MAGRKQTIEDRINKAEAVVKKNTRQPSKI